MKNQFIVIYYRLDFFRKYERALKASVGGFM